MKKTKIINRLHDQKTKLDEFVIILYLIYVYIYILYTYVIRKPALSAGGWCLHHSSSASIKAQQTTTMDSEWWRILQIDIDMKQHHWLDPFLPDRLEFYWFSLHIPYLSISILVYPMVSLAIFAASNPLYVCCWRSFKDLSWHGWKIHFPSQQLANLNYQVHFITVHKRCEHI